MKHFNNYTVMYRPHKNSPVKITHVLADNKRDAWLFIINKRFYGKKPVSAWVHGRTYLNGSFKTFKTDERHPY